MDEDIVNEECQEQREKEEKFAGMEETKEMEIL